MSAVGNKIPNFNQVAQLLEAEGVPFPPLMLFGGIIFLIAGGLSVVAGYRTQIGAGMLLIFLVLATYYFHDFWNFEGEAQQQQMIQFMKNAALAGAMLLLIANGPGGLSVDGTAKPAKVEEPRADT